MLRAGNEAVIELQSVSQMDRVVVLPEAPPGPIYSFVPAGGGMPAGGSVAIADRGPTGGALHASDPRVAEMTRRLVLSLQTCLKTDGDTRTVLLADFEKDSGARIIPRPSTITCADLSHANPEQEWLAVKMSEAIFVVSATDPASMNDAREKAEWLRAIKAEDCYGLLLLPSPGGATGCQAEDITGLPVCAVLQNDQDIADLARWIAQE